MTAWNRKQFSTHKNNKQLISDKARQMSTNNIINILKAPVIIHRLSGGGKGMEDLVCVTIKLTWSSFKALLYSFDSLSPPPQSIFFRLPLCTLLATTEPPVPPENHVIPAKNSPTPPPPPSVLCHWYHDTKEFWLDDKAYRLLQRKPHWLTLKLLLESLTNSTHF